MNPSTKKPVFQKLLCLISMLIGTGCTQADAPSDQLIQGPFTITTEWQVFALDKPLQTMPLTQSLMLLLDHSRFEKSLKSEIKPKDIGRYFVRKSDDTTVQAEVILLSDSYEYFKASYHSIGTQLFSSGEKKSMGYGLYGDDGIHYFPEGTQFTAIKIRANTKFTVDSFYWVAPRYHQAPSRTWSEIHPSQVAKLQQTTLLQNEKNKN